MDIAIRKMLPEEYPLLSDFLYEAIFQRDETDLLPRSVIDEPALRIYIEAFGSKDDDICFCAVSGGKPVGAAWVRNICGYGNIGAQTPELAMSLYKDFRGQGLGTAMLEALMEYMKCTGYEKLSLSVQKDNYAVKLYNAVGFRVIDENDEEFIMVKDL